MKHLNSFNESFKKKTVKVRDYPDPAFKIEMYGKSDTSKYKVGDKVYIIDNDRVGHNVLKVIGFDEEGDCYVDPCPWSNTRGGFDDKSLIYKKEYDKIENNLPKKFEEMLNKDLEKLRKYFKDESPKELNRILKNGRKSFILENWYKIK